MFEPTDLEWETPGQAEFDLQVGAIRGPDAFRLSVPDFEFDLGLTKQLEIDVDGAFALEGPSDGALRYAHFVVDNLWLALKAGLLTFTDRTRSRTFSTGLQLGPKLPTARQAHGLGVESLVLLGLTLEHTYFASNLGALLDPAIGASRRPAGVEGGLAFREDLNATGNVAFVAEFGAVLFKSSDPNQAHVTAGVSWDMTPDWSVSAITLVGLLPGNDRYGVLLGASPKIRFFEK
jgi:hypothetical protein